MFFGSLFLHLISEAPSGAEDEYRNKYCVGVRDGIQAANGWIKDKHSYADWKLIG